MAEVSRPSRRAWSDSIRQYIKSHARELVALPEPPQTYVLQPDDDAEYECRISRGVHGRLVQGGAIEVAEGLDHSKDRRTYRVDKAAYSRALEHVERVPSLPCGEGHTGFETITAGSEYECTVCGEVHDRETVEEHLFGADPA